tara:strand:+ start:484 stop:591 length:108 start_codon:yes stop_codon:yes gene_type:complete
MGSFLGFPVNPKRYGGREVKASDLFEPLLVAKKDK